MIDWNEMLEGYNKKFNKTHKKPESMLRELYENKNIHEVEKILGVSCVTFRKKLKEFKITKPKGGDSYGDKEKRFLDISCEKMTLMTRVEIMRACSISYSYFGFLRKKHNRNYNRR